MRISMKLIRTASSKGMIHGMLGCFLLSMLAATPVSAVGYQSPDEDNVNPQNGTVLSYDVSNASYNYVPSTTLDIYAPSQWIAVSIAGGDMCTTPNGLAGTKDVLNAGMNVIATNAPVTQFTLTGDGGGTSTDFGQKRTDARCDRFKNYQQFPATGVGQIIPPTGENYDGPEAGGPANTDYNRDGTAKSTHTLSTYSTSGVQTDVGTLYHFRLNALWVAGCNYVANGDCGVNSFRVQALNSSGGPGSTYDNGNYVYISQVSNPNGVAAAQSMGLNVGVHATDYTDFSQYFGPDCSIPSGSVQDVSIGIYDPDNNSSSITTANSASPPTHMLFGIRVEEADKGALNFAPIPLTNDFGSGFPFTTFDTSSDPGWYRMDTADGATGAFRFNVVGGKQYRLRFKNFGYRNNISISLPYPAVGVRTCPAEAIPHAAFAQPRVEVGKPVTGLGSVSNGKTSQSASNWNQYLWADLNLDKRYDPATENLIGAPGRSGTSAYPPLGSTDIGNINGAVPDSIEEYTSICTAVYLTGFNPAYTTTNVYTFPDGSTLAGYDVTCKPAEIIGDKPFFSVRGADALAGPGFASGGSCTPDTTASIIGSNNDNHLGAPYYNGSGSQLGAIALSKIKAFATAKQQIPGGWIDSVTGGGPVVGSASELAFSNQGSAVSGNVYGGNFAQTNWCVPDYYSNASSAGATDPGAAGTITALTNPAGASGTTKTYVHNGDMVLNSGTMPANGQRVIIKVNGDVNITGDISYANPGTVEKIPQLQILATGSIYVHSGVKRLDGFYDAQGTKAGSKGYFVTCSNASKTILTGLSSIAPCNVPLTINGPVAAKKVIPNRTFGDWQGIYGPPSPAETFQFSPQYWLPSVTQTGGVGPWQSVTSLPPIL